MNRSGNEDVPQMRPPIPCVGPDLPEVRKAGFMTDQSASKIPERIKYVMCPVCGKRAGSFASLPRGSHMHHGRRCYGMPEEVVYVREKSSR